MRSSFGFGGLFLFLAGCSTPSCDFQLSCRNDYDCGIAQICQSSFLLNACEDVLLCDGNPCPAGEECIQREGVPSGNPFEDALPGKHVCQGPTVVGPGGTGGGGTGGSTGGTGGVPSACQMPAQTGELLAAESGGTPSSESRPFLSPHSSGGVFYSYSFGSQPADAGFALSFRAADGTVEWSEVVTSGAPTLLAQSALGNGAVAAASFTGQLTLGDVTLDSGSGTAVALFRIRADGTFFDARMITSDDLVTVNAVAPAKFANRVTIGGAFRGNLTIGDDLLASTGGVDGFVAVLDLDTGKDVWTTQLGGVGDAEITAIALSETTGVTFAGANFTGQVVFGTTGNLMTADTPDAFVWRLDSESGAPLGQHSITGPDREVVTGLSVNPLVPSVVVIGARASDVPSDGELSLGGGVFYPAKGLVDGYVFEMTEDGYDVFSSYLLAGPKGTGEAFPRAVAVDCAGHVLVAGSATDGLQLGVDSSPSAGMRDAFVAKLSPNKKPLWSYFSGGPDDDEAFAVLPRGAESVWIAGTFRDTATFGDQVLTSEGSDDLFLLQVTP